MSRKTAGAWGLLGVLLLVALPSSAAMAAGAGEDDLAVVKRALAASSTPQAEAAPKPRPSEPTASPKTTTQAKGDKPQWLRVRVVDKGRRGGKVSINLPLSVVRAVGDDIDFDCNRRDRSRRDDDSGEKGAWRDKECTIRISEILKALDSGQDLVEIEDEEATVRVWVD